MNGIRTKMQDHLDNLTKPRGSLGDLEEIGIKLAQIQGRVPPRIDRRVSVVFAADHGIVDEGVSLYPREVTTQMVLNFLSGGAAINVMASHCGADVWVVDSGVAGEIKDDRVIDMKVGKGTRNFAREDAMTQAELQYCLDRGRELAERVRSEGYDLVSVGDMGIGNTTTAAALLAANGLDLELVVDRGTGIDDQTLLHKRDVIQSALARHEATADVHTWMRRVGGFEICMIAGFVLGLRGTGVACVLDGFPVTAGAYLAWKLDPELEELLFAGHQSKVKGHSIVLREMGLKPILDLNMRLGEGTGAVLGGYLVSVAARVAGEMASFDSAGVSRSDGDEQDY